MNTFANNLNIMQNPTTPPRRQQQTHLEGPGCLLTPATSPNHGNNIGNNAIHLSNSFNTTASSYPFPAAAPSTSTAATATTFVYACTSHLFSLASSIQALLPRLSSNADATKACRRLHFEAVELLKSILRAEEAGMLGDGFGYGNDGRMTQQMKLGLRVVWAVEMWRDFETRVKAVE